MAWAFIEYPWEALLENRILWNTIPDFIRPDNGAGILFCQESYSPASTRLLNHSLGGHLYSEIAGPSLRDDGFKDFSVKLVEGQSEHVIQYRDVSETEPQTLSAQFHDTLTNSLQEFSAILFDERKKVRNNFYEKTLNDTVDVFFDTHSEDFAFRALICEIADETKPEIEAIVKQPRKVLQRKHAQVGLDRLQEMDIASLMDYARRPGESALLKAGDRQRLMAVVREETANTLENRVVKDFCRRARNVAKLYVAECCSWCRKGHSETCDRKDKPKCRSRRVEEVDSFARICDRWLTAAELAPVTVLQSPCRMPNYALLQNVRYVKVWDYYQRLLNQEDIRDQTWCWKRQAWTDYVRILMMHVMSEFTLDGEAPAFQASRKPVRLRKNPNEGTWLKKEPFDGPIVFDYKGNFISLYLFNKEDVDRMFEHLSVPLASLNADLYWVAVSTDWQELRVVPIWTFVGDARWHGNRAGELRNKCVSDIRAVATIWQEKVTHEKNSYTVTLSRLVVLKPSYFGLLEACKDDKVELLEAPMTKDASRVCFHMAKILQETLQ
jgi:hypothetical protein